MLEWPFQPSGFRRVVKFCVGAPHGSGPLNHKRPQAERADRMRADKEEQAAREAERRVRKATKTERREEKEAAQVQPFICASAALHLPFLELSFCCVLLPCRCLFLSCLSAAFYCPVADMSCCKP